MWISARTAVVLVSALCVFAVIAVAAPLIPRPHLPSLPQDRLAKAGTSERLGAALPILEGPERVRAQTMVADAPSLPSSARWSSLVGTGRPAEPNEEIAGRLVALLKDARTVSDPRAGEAKPAWVVRYARGEQKVDVMVDTKNDRLVVALDGKAVGTYSVAGLHREFVALGAAVFA